MEFRMICKNGDTRNVLNNAFAVRSEDGTVVRIIGALRDLTDLKLLQEKLVREQVDKKKKLLEGVIEAQERERNEIGKELHDNVNQLLTVAKLMLDSAKNNPDKREAFLVQTEQMIVQALKENRGISHRLISPTLELEDFSEAIQMLADLLNLTGNIEVSVKLSSSKIVQSVDTRLRLSIYRIIQEQVGNIIKHANAKNASIGLIKAENIWTLTIWDDGVGFDTATRRKGIGLNNICSRVEVHNGSIRIISFPGQGCKLEIKIPCH
jgi:signal transduction histidine kinase